MGNSLDPAATGRSGNGQPSTDGRSWYNMFDPMGLTPLGYHPPPAYLPNYDQNNQQLDSLLKGQSPYASQDWGTLIQQLQGRANGTAPSVAGMQYQQAQQNTASNLAGMAHGGNSPAAFRQAAIQQGQVGQGMAAGVAQARTNEMMQSQNALTGALGQRDQLNQHAYLEILAQKMGLSKDQMAALMANTQQQTNGMAGQMQGASGLLGAVAAF